MSATRGLLIDGRYRLEERLAVGGMGEVWRGHDETLERTVAVKVLRPDTAEDSAFVERFRTEALHSAALTHPNIAAVYDFGEGEHAAYIVMELVAGEPLSRVIAERAPISAEETTAILSQAALALQAAHDSGVVHRDVKPGNIMVSEDGVAKLTDFGISRATEGSALTQTGEVLGTPHYLSPEQAQGYPATPASDVYALAVVGHEMLTGRRPFEAESMIGTALAHVSRPVPPLPDSVPEPLRTTVLASLNKDPAHRPQSAAAFAACLGMPAGTAPPGLSPEEPATPATPAALAGGAGAAAAAAGGSATGAAPPRGAGHTSATTSVLALPRASGPHRWEGPTAWRGRAVAAGAALLLAAGVAAVLTSNGGRAPATTHQQTPGSAASTRPTTAAPTTTTTTRTSQPSTTTSPARSTPSTAPAVGATPAARTSSTSGHDNGQGQPGTPNPNSTKKHGKGDGKP